MSVFDVDKTDSDSVSKAITPEHQLHSTKPKTFQQWQNIRRSMGSKYYTPRVQSQMQKDAAALGQSYFEKRKEEWE